MGLAVMSGIRRIDGNFESLTLISGFSFIFLPSYRHSGYAPPENFHWAGVWQANHSPVSHPLSPTSPTLPVVLRNWLAGEPILGKAQPDQEGLGRVARGWSQADQPGKEKFARVLQMMCHTQRLPQGWLFMVGRFSGPLHFAELQS